MARKFQSMMPRSRVWEVLHNTIRSLGIESKQDLPDWIHNQGFPRPRWGAHFSGPAQKRIWNTAIARDLRGIGYEALYVHVVMEACREETMEVEEPEPGMRTQDRPLTGWEDLDDVCLRRVFECRFRVLQGSPAFLKERFSW